MPSYYDSTKKKPGTAKNIGRESERLKNVFGKPLKKMLKNVERGEMNPLRSSRLIYGRVSLDWSQGQEGKKKLLITGLLLKNSEKMN